MNKPQRINWIDMAKGYGMLLVLFGHMGDFGKYGLILHWIYSFHMPLFFFLSGFVFKTTDRFAVYFKKKIHSLIIPYFCLGFVAVLFQILTDYLNGMFDLSEALYYFVELIIQRRFFTIWFLACLFLTSIIFYFADKKLKKNSYLAVFSGLSLIAGWLYAYYVGIALPWNIDIVFMAIPFYFAGYYFKQKYESIEKYLKKPSVIVVSLLLTGILNVSLYACNYLITGHRFDMFDGRYGVVPLSYLAAFAGIGFIFLVSLITNIKPIRYIGENSIIYLAWHQTIMIPIVQTGFEYIAQKLHFSISRIPVVIYYLIVLLFVVALLSLINELISRTKLRFIIGKRVK